ncbi:MAG: ABC transporter permease [Planctomycetota bacterium]|jgi:putative ABC transport system permease protein
MRVLIQGPIAFIRLLYQSAYLALGQIWTNKTRSILTTIGIVIGVASVTAVIAALTGLKAKVLTQVETFGSNTIFIQPRFPDRGPTSHMSWWSIRLLPEDFEGMLEHCPSVERYTRVSRIRQTVRYGERSVNDVHVTGVEPSWHEIENRPIELGRRFSIIDETRPVCLIDPELRDNLHLDKDCIGESIRIGYHTFRIVGVIERKPEIGFFEGGQEIYEVFIPFKMIFKFGEPGIWALGESKTTEVLEEAVAEVKFFLRRMRRIKAGESDTFMAESLKSAIQAFNTIALVVTLVASGIVGISLLVGGVGIMNIMLVSVSERTREIGLRKAVGAKKSAVLAQFLVESVVLCFVGGLVGVGIAQLLILVIPQIYPVLDKTYIPAWAIILSFGFAGSVGIFFGMFPAIKAARLDPIEALRHE